jgi:hypothetical protein
MNRDEFHYTVTATLLLEAQLAARVHPEKAAAAALLAARADAMVDKLTPDHVASDRALRYTMATQVRPGAPGTVAIAATDGIWPIMQRVNRFHFAWRLRPRWPGPESDNEEGIVRYGVVLHTYQDAGEPGCPHRGYTGFPENANYERSRKLGKVSGWERFATWALRKRDRTWGHMLDSAADDIVRCREGALATSLAVYRDVSGRKDALAPSSFEQSVQEHTQTIWILKDTDSDRDMDVRCRMLWLFLAGFELPKFSPLEGEQLRWFAGEVV